MDTTTPPPADQPAPPPIPPASQPFSPPTPPPAPPYPAPARSGSDGFFDALRRVGVVRTNDRWVGGVAGGVALRLGIDPLLVRGIFGVTALFGGAGMIVYGLAWALLPEQSDGRIHLQETIRGRFDAALLGAIGLFVVGVGRGDGSFGWGYGQGLGWISGVLWFAAIATVAGLVITSASQRGNRGPSSPPRGPWQGGGASAPGAGAPGAGVPNAGVPVAAPPAPAPRAAYPTASAGSTGYAGPPTTSYAGPRGAYAPPAAGHPAAPGGYSGAQGGYAGPPAGYYPPPVPQPPRRPAKPRVHGPGASAIGAVVGLTLVALAVLLVLDRTRDGLDLSVGLTAAGIGIVLAGLGIMIAGLRGRSSGTLGFLAIVGIVLAVPAATLTEATWSGTVTGPRVFVTDSVWQPTTASQARAGMSAALGDITVDLTQLPAGSGKVEVPISLGAGDMTVTVPRDIAVSAEVQIGAGQIDWAIDGDQQVSGVSGAHQYDFASTEVTDGASPTLVLQLKTGAGQISVVEAD